MKLIRSRFLLVLAGARRAAQETRIAAVVNDDIVTAGDLNARLKLVSSPPAFRTRRKIASASAPQVLRTLIDEKLEMQEAKQLSIIGAAGRDRQGARQHRAAQQHAQGRARRLSQGARAFRAARSSIRSPRRSPSRRSCQTRVVAGRAGLRRRGQRRDEAAARPISASRKAASPRSSSRSTIRPRRTRSSQLADRLIEQIRGGANFAAVAQQFSQSPSAAVGGDIGWVTPSQLEPAARRGARQDEPGRDVLSGPHAGGLLHPLSHRPPDARPTNPDADHARRSSRSCFRCAPTRDARRAQQREARGAAASRTTAKSCGEMAKIGARRAPQLSRQIPQMRGERPAARHCASRSSRSRSPRRASRWRSPAASASSWCASGRTRRACRRATRLSDSIARERLDALARRYLRDLRRGAYVDIRG